eukprot:scaffold13704_cov102-Isochrysis_galbana.AAC.5
MGSGHVALHYQSVQLLEAAGRDVRREQLRRSALGPDKGAALLQPLGHGGPVNQHHQADHRCGRREHNSRRGPRQIGARFESQRRRLAPSGVGGGCAIEQAERVDECGLGAVHLLLADVDEQLEGEQGVHGDGERQHPVHHVVHQPAPAVDGQHQVERRHREREGEAEGEDLDQELHPESQQSLGRAGVQLVHACLGLGAPGEDVLADEVLRPGQVHHQLDQEDVGDQRVEYERHSQRHRGDGDAAVEEGELEHGGRLARALGVRPLHQVGQQGHGGLLGDEVEGGLEQPLGQEVVVGLEQVDPGQQRDRHEQQQCEYCDRQRLPEQLLAGRELQVLPDDVAGLRRALDDQTAAKDAGEGAPLRYHLDGARGRRALVEGDKGIAGAVIDQSALGLPPRVVEHRARGARLDQGDQVQRRIDVPAAGGRGREGGEWGREREARHQHI